jgi:transcriptional regulator GlxA family with amidase domain
MRLAFVLFDGLTMLDFIGFYDPVTRLKSMDLVPDFSWDLCGLTADLQDDRGFTFRVDRIHPDLSAYDAIFVPGGMATRDLMKDENVFLPWLRTAEPCRAKVSVCTGSLLLGSAGVLKGKKATTHPNAVDLLRPLCGGVLPDRVVRDGDLWSGGGVSSSLDLGLAYCENLVGAENRRKIQAQMDYPHFLF